MIENLDIRNFRKWMRSVHKSCAAMVDAVEVHSQALVSALPSFKPQKQKKKKPKKKGKGKVDDEAFLDVIIVENSID